MKKLAFALVMGAFGASAFADIYNNGPVVTDIGAGAGGADISRLNADPLSGTFGLAAGRNASSPGPYYMADDFTNPLSTKVKLTRVTVYAYTNNATATTLNGAFIKVLDAAPDGANNLMYGDFVTSRGQNMGFWVNGDTGHEVYRVSNMDNASNTQKKIQKADIILGTGVELGPGQTVWLVWTFAASGTTSIFVPMVSHDYANGRGNAFQRKRASDGSDNWAPALATATDEGSRVELPYQAEYETVPEPGTIIAVGAGLAALVARRRRKA